MKRNAKGKGKTGRMSSSNAPGHASTDRRTNGERRNGSDKRREHDRFSPGKKSSDRRQNDRRSGRN